jgi:hypothetical protein
MLAGVFRRALPGWARSRRRVLIEAPVSGGVAHGRQPNPARPGPTALSTNRVEPRARVRLLGGDGTARTRRPISVERNELNIAQNDTRFIPFQADHVGYRDVGSVDGTLSSNQRRADKGDRSRRRLWCWVSARGPWGRPRASPQSASHGSGLPHHRRARRPRVDRAAQSALNRTHDTIIAARIAAVESPLRVAQ